MLLAIAKRFDKILKTEKNANLQFNFVDGLKNFVLKRNREGDKKTTLDELILKDVLNYYDEIPEDVEYTDDIKNAEHELDNKNILRSLDKNLSILDSHNPEDVNIQQLDQSNLNINSNGYKCCNRN